VTPAPTPPRFLADAMLGRLARWLRVLGFDTAYDPTVHDPALVRMANAEGRVLLTRDRHLAALPAPLPPDEAAALVPPAARGLPGPVRRCEACGRVYWPGSHVRRMRRAIDAVLPGWGSAGLAPGPDRPPVARRLRDSAGTQPGDPMADRDKYRDNDDVRDPLPPDERVGTKSDSKSEARGDARENIGNTAHDQHRPGGPQGR
jgi:hypothetical protein